MWLQIYDIASINANLRLIDKNVSFDSSVAIQQLGPEEDNVVRAFCQLRDTYKELFKTNFGWDKLG